MMTEPGKWLEKNRELLVSAACDSLVGTFDDVQVAQPAVESFVDAMIVASGGANRSPNIWHEGVAGIKRLSGGESARVVATIGAVTRVTAGLMAEGDTPDEALSLLGGLNNLLDQALAVVVEDQVGSMLDAVGQPDVAQAAWHKLEDSKSRFIAVAAHELKTPLTLVEGYANMLNQEFPAEEYPRVALMVGGIANGTARLRDIIGDMIDVSLIDMDILELHMQPVWLGRLIEIVVSELGPAAAARNLALKADNFQEQDRAILADPERLHQVLRNVILNAIKYTPDGGEVSVSVKSLPDSYDIRVRDTGIGIDADDLPRIFNKFSSTGDVALHSSSKTSFKGGGPGLGLAIARGIVEAHGGNIWAESAGHDEQALPGSTFHVVIPMKSDSRRRSAPVKPEMEELLDATQPGEGDSGAKP